MAPPKTSISKRASKQVNQRLKLVLTHNAQIKDCKA